MTRLQAHYRIRCAPQEIAAQARALAIEQSVEVPLEAIGERFVLEQIVGRVESVEPAGEQLFDVVIGLALETTGFEIAQTVNMLFGNSSLHPHIELTDVDFPEAFLARFQGPRFGAHGLRERLGATGRPLTCAAIKPQGLSCEALAALCETFARGGVDVIKDDHGLADQSYSPFAERVRACQRAVERANRQTGGRSIYAPSLVGSPRMLARQAHIAQAEGAGMVLVAPGLVGLAAFAELVAEDLSVPVLAHPAFAGAARMAPQFVFGKLFRLLGADAVIYTHAGGRFGYSETLCRAIAARARAPWAGLRPAMPVPAGGMSVERVGELVALYGNEVMLLIGGSLLIARDALLDRTARFVACTRQAAATQGRGQA